MIVRGMMGQTSLKHTQLKSGYYLGVADYRYAKNGNTQQCNIFRHNK